MIVKFVSGDGSGHRLMESVRDIEFYFDRHGDAYCTIHYLTIAGVAGTEAHDVPVMGKVYVMNDRGHTIDTFDPATKPPHLLPIEGCTGASKASEDQAASLTA